MKSILAALILLCSACSAICQDRAMGIDADPFLLYLGNLVGGSPTTPVWQGPESIPKGFVVGRYRVKKDDWIRYRVSLQYLKSTDRISVIGLDNDLNEVEGLYSEDVSNEILLMSSVSVELEERIGTKSLQGLLGKGIGLSVHRNFQERLVTNPLEAYLGDTLWRETGYGAAATLFFLTGVQFNITSSLALSARMNYGISFGVEPKTEYRSVVQEGGEAVLETFAESQSSSFFQVGLFMRPRIMLSLYF